MPGNQVTGRAPKRNSGKKASEANGPMLDSRKFYDKVASEDVGRLSVAENIRIS